MVIQLAPAMLRNTVDCQADLNRFVSRVASAETIWYLHSDEGTASCESNDYTTKDDEPVTVLLFFSDEAYARRCQKAHFQDHDVESMSLFDFLYRWLPGMSGDGLIAGANWNQDLVGLEADPFDLREQLETALSPAQLERHAEKHRSLTRGA